MWLKPFPLKQWKEQPCFPGFSQVYDSKSISVIKAKCWLTRELLSIVCLIQVWCFWFHGINGLQELVAVRWVVKQWGRSWQLKSRLRPEKSFPHTFLLWPLFTYFHVVSYIDNGRIWMWNWGELLWRWLPSTSPSHPHNRCYPQAYLWGMKGQCPGVRWGWDGDLGGRKRIDFPVCLG